MSIHPMAGKTVPISELINIPHLISAYYTEKPDPETLEHAVSFGTSGHRGSSFDRSFNEDHILAISQAIVEYRKINGISGPLYLGMDTHALSEPSHTTAIEVFAANDIELIIHQNKEFTPTPVISHAILTYNLGKSSALADGVVISPSHNPPRDGGFKYNPPSGGPADTSITQWIQKRANEMIQNKLLEVKKLPIKKALLKGNVHQRDLIMPYVKDLANVVDMSAISASKIKIGVDPLGGSGIHYWDFIADFYHLNIEVVNSRIDPTFSFMTLDHDGKIRMDCSSSYAMAGLVQLKDQFDIAFGNDVDYDRHGIVTPSIGLMDPNHYLATAIWYLFQHRPLWGKQKAIGKTLVSSSIIDRVAGKLGISMCEVPVGFKWFVPGLLDGSIGFGGEESAGASFLRFNGDTWTTDKDGFILDFLAAEMVAITGYDPGQIFLSLQKELGMSWYDRVDAPAGLIEKRALANLTVEMVTASQLAGDPIINKLTDAPCNQASFGGLKVESQNGWFAARPSGTEDIYKIYAESSKSEAHLRQIQKEARQMVDRALKDTK